MAKTLLVISCLKKNCCDPNLGEGLCIFTFFLFPSIERFWFLIRSILNGVTLETSNEERFDPNGVENIPHVLTIKSRLTTFAVIGKIECVYHWCFNNAPVYFWLNFKLKKEQEIAVESVSMIKTYLSCCLPRGYMLYTGVCGPKRYGFSAVLDINWVSILADLGHFGHK